MFADVGRRKRKEGRWSTTCTMEGLIDSIKDLESLDDVPNVVDQIQSVAADESSLFSNSEFMNAFKDSEFSENIAKGLEDDSSFMDGLGEDAQKEIRDIAEDDGGGGKEKKKWPWKVRNPCAKRPKLCTGALALASYAAVDEYMKHKQEKLKKEAKECVAMCLPSNYPVKTGAKPKYQDKMYGPKYNVDGKPFPTCTSSTGYGHECFQYCVKNCAPQETFCNTFPGAEPACKAGHAASGAMKHMWKWLTSNLLHILILVVVAIVVLLIIVFGGKEVFHILSKHKKPKTEPRVIKMSAAQSRHPGGE